MVVAVVGLRQVLLVAAAVAAAAGKQQPTTTTAAATAKAAAAAAKAAAAAAKAAAAAAAMTASARDISTTTTTSKSNTTATTASTSTTSTTTTTGAPRDGSGRFYNPWPSWTGDKTLREVVCFAREMRALKCPAYGWLTGNRRPTRADMAAAFPVNAPDYAGLEAAAAAAAGGGSTGARVAAIWAGHASVLVRIGGATFLTDPVFAERASPVQWAGGPPRAVPPPVRADDPGLSIDAVLISHNHYDHLCAPTVKALYARFGPRLKWYAPLGVGAWLRRRGIANVTELDWWESAVHHNSGGGGGSGSGDGSDSSGTPVTVMVTLTPAQHWSARGVFDRRGTLWGGFALATGAGTSAGADSSAGSAQPDGAPNANVAGAGARFFFAGDSGYGPFFKDIGARLGPFDLAAIPTGAYAPRGFMAPQHMDPGEAVRAHLDVGARRSIAVHCCTFHLTLEPLDEPPALLAREAAAAGLAADEFVTLQHGAGIGVGADGAIVWPPAPLLTLPVRPAHAPAADGGNGFAGAAGGGAEGAAAAFDKLEL